MIHPRDHILCLSVQLRSDYTDVTKVSASVRVNGGAATVYTSATAPAVTQAQDCAFGYHLELPAGSFADGDRVSRTWLYNGVAVAYGDTIVGPAALDGAHYTSARGDKLDDLDATVSSRSTYAGGDTAGTTTLLGRLTAQRAANLDNLDAAISGVAAAVWGAGARTLTAIGDSVGVTTLLGRLTALRATALDLLDATVSSRATPADVDVKVQADLTGITATVAAIKARTDLLGQPVATLATAQAGADVPLRMARGSQFQFSGVALNGNGVPVDLLAASTRVEFYAKRRSIDTDAAAVIRKDGTVAPLVQTYGGVALAAAAAYTVTIAPGDTANLTATELLTYEVWWTPPAGPRTLLSHGTFKILAT